MFDLHYPNNSMITPFIPVGSACGLRFVGIGRSRARRCPLDGPLCLNALGLQPVCRFALRCGAVGVGCVASRYIGRLKPRSWTVATAVADISMQPAGIAQSMRRGPTSAGSTDSMCCDFTPSAPGMSSWRSTSGPAGNWQSCMKMSDTDSTFGWQLRRESLCGQLSP